MFSSSLFSSSPDKNSKKAGSLTPQKPPQEPFPRLFNLRFFRVAFLAFTFLLGLLGAQQSADANDAEELIAEAQYTLSNLLADKEFDLMHRYLDQAKGVLIIPQLIKAGFLFAAEGGSGVLLVKRSDGSWSQPAFYALVAGSVGLQFGGKVEEAIFVLTNDGAVEATLSDEVRLGADLSIAVGPIGRGIRASTTTNLGKDIYAFSHSIGLFSGGALEGAKLFERETLNELYYGKYATARAIVQGDRFSNPQAKRLRSILQRTGAKTPR